MKLYKALKLKKSLIGEIAKIKEQIITKNSYLVGSVNSEKYNLDEYYAKLLKKIDELTGLKYVINQANQEIQPKIYVLSEYKALISFWNSVSVDEGMKKLGHYTETIHEFKVHFNEGKRDEIVNAYQQKVDAIQEEIDVYNYNTEIPWDFTD